MLKHKCTHATLADVAGNGRGVRRRSSPPQETQNFSLGLVHVHAKPHAFTQSLHFELLTTHTPILRLAGLPNVYEQMVCGTFFPLTSIPACIHPCLPSAPSPPRPWIMASTQATCLKLPAFFSTTTTCTSTLHLRLQLPSPPRLHLTSGCPPCSLPRVQLECQAR